MKLFFETVGQAQIFLCALPIGFLLALMLDVNRNRGALRPLWDVLCMLAAAGMLLGMMMLRRDGGLRVYHALALLTGALLYAGGVRRVALGTARRWRNWKKARISGTEPAGESRETSNRTNHS